MNWWLLNHPDYLIKLQGSCKYLADKKNLGQEAGLITFAGPQTFLGQLAIIFCLLCIQGTFTPNFERNCKL